MVTCRLCDRCSRRIGKATTAAVKIGKMVPVDYATGAVEGLVGPQQLQLRLVKLEARMPTRLVPLGLNFY